MADQLASPEDLASLLERDDIDTYKATVLVETATAIVQAAARGQRIVQVTDDVATLMGSCDLWLQLPQIPVLPGDVSAVTVDGSAVTDWKQFGSRLFRRCGWQKHFWEPSTIEVTYTHGYAPGDQRLQLGRSAVLSMCQGAYGNPQGLSAESIDDYKVTYSALTNQMAAAPQLRDMISQQYGRRAGLVKLG